MGRIAKIGDQAVRTVLYEAAHVILTRAIKAGGIKSWAMRIAKRAGMRRPKLLSLVGLRSSCIGCWRVEGRR
jgi:transposase